MSKNISDKVYEHVLKDWNRFEMETMTSYHEKLKNSSSKSYGLFANHYLNVPALIWDAMLNMKKVKLEVIIDEDVYLLFEKGMRGGASYIFKRYDKANNKYIKSYDLKQQSMHISYLDPNNLYGY